MDVDDPSTAQSLPDDSHSQNSAIPVPDTSPKHESKAGLQVRTQHSVCACVGRESQRQRETDRQRQTETDRQTDREKEREIHGYILKLSHTDK